MATYLDVGQDEMASWIDEVHRLLKWFGDHHHFSHTQREWPSEAELRQNVERFEHALLRFTHTFFGLLERGEQIIANVSEQGGVPTKDDTDYLVTILEWSPEFQRPLLERLGPEWLNPLHACNIFTDSPKAEHVEGGGIRFPRWPPSRYLARMASKAPREVAQIFAKIETDNASIISDMLDAALAMPPDVSVSFVPAICRAAREGTLWIHFKDATDLCVRLAEGGEPDAAVDLAEALFTPKLEDGQKELRHRDQYWYKDGLKKVIPVLAGPRADSFLPKLCDWLNASVRARTKKHRDQEPGSDYSYVWRPAIEEHEQNHDYDFAGVMVGFVREGFEQGIRNQRLSLEEALEIVGRYSYLVFKRIRIHLINEFANQDPRLARQVMLDQELFYNYECKHEYALLVGRRFAMLEAAEQAEWLRWIHDGPTGEVAEALDEPDDRDLSGRRRNYWRFERLHWVRDHLTGEDKRFYQEMREKHGEPDMADLSFRTGAVRWGHDSPMTVGQLGGMTFEQAVDAVSSWKPEGSRFIGPDIEGLASTFGQYVATNPDQFSMKARVLINRPAIFVREFIRQMSEATKAGREIDLPAVLELCHWVVTRPIEERTTPEQEGEVLVDKNWQWTRDKISELVENVCKAKSADMPRYPLDDVRQPMWKLMESVCHDRAESYIVRDISQDDLRVHDYLNLGINSPRGKAVEGALEYARWVANHIKQSDGEHEVVPGGFNAMPEVRKMLEWQIAPENRSFEALSVIGLQIGLIYWIDRQWLTENADRLFQLETIERTPSATHGWAAWNAFLVWVRPRIEFYRVFKSQFAYAVVQAAEVKSAERGREQPMYCLGEHLMILYARGELGLHDDEGLLKRFLMNSNPDVRRHAIDFVGETLKGDEELPGKVVERLMTLWDLYWSGPGPRDAKEEPNAFLFGLWFWCGRFPEQWSLDRLERFVEVVPTPEPDQAVAEKLAEIAHVDIVKSVRILDRMVRGDREGWRVDGWLDPAKKILGQAMKELGEARERSLALIDYLGRRGYTDFGQLLRETPGGGS